MNNTSKNIKMVLIVTPQLLDLQSSMLNNYVEFYENLSRKYIVLILLKILLILKNYKKYYLSDIWRSFK